MTDCPTVTEQVGITSAASFVLHALDDEVPYEWWLMTLPGILVGSTIGPWCAHPLFASSFRHSDKPFITVIFTFYLNITGIILSNM
jgi:uncharacterized membrane protein YfcA